MWGEWSGVHDIPCVTRADSKCGCVCGICVHSFVCSFVREFSKRHAWLTSRIIFFTNEQETSHVCMKVCMRE